MTAISEPKTSKVTPLLEALSRGVDAATGEPSGSGSRDVTNAMTGRRLGVIPQCTPDDVVAAAGRARAVQRAWAQRPLAERTAVMLRFHDLVLRRQEEILDIIQLESGKARAHAFEEVADVCLTARY